MFKFFKLLVLLFISNLLFAQHTLYFEIPPSPYTGINKIQNLSEILIFPNPASNHINIEVKDFSNFKLEILDINGKTIDIETYNFENFNINIDISNLEKGFYILQIRDEEKFYRKSFIKI
ncbi:MAG: T9SS type A sorting domain-containing protein [Bacteroidales bacterium]|jgi:hypothetical protein|nr:T9SS type A sorting domain-containing protein [Bacteroidales bacterium]MCK9498444.1 T9SS type A sorting domain-containing protein [Bacteroidales bacterium]MDY0315766.1 T9SS type A sorting domain-containing protein [Bacteroidales bacterium]NLB85754.1 T9SS type A sorting domain-containing protein [Bacteroidales bacterium]